MRAIALQHVTVGVHDLDAAVAFYELLGMTVSPDRPAFSFPGAWMQATPTQQVHIVVTPGRAAPDAMTHFALVVDDLDVCLTDLRAGGVPEDRIQRLRHVPGAGVQAFVQDPTGNVVELNQPE